MVAGVHSSTYSYARLQAFIAFALLATISFLAIFAFNPGHNDLMSPHQRRSFIARQDSSSSSQTASRVSAGTSTPSSISQSSTSIPVSATASQSSIRSSTVTPPAITTSISSSLRSSASRSSFSSSSASSSSSPQISSSSGLPSSLSSSTLPSITSTVSVVVPTTNTPLNIAPATTLIMTNSFQLPTGAPTPTTQTQSTDSNTPTSLPVGASATSSEFWNNKAAVVATFIIVAVAICGAIGLGILYFLKRRNARMERDLHEELFEKHADPHRSLSPSSSINGAPIDPFASDNDLRVRHNQQGSVDSHHSSSQGYHNTTPIQHPDFYEKSSPFSDYVVASTYLLPSRAAEATRPGPPSAFRSPAAKRNARASYQPSLDSFYGGIAQGPSTGYPHP